MTETKTTPIESLHALNNGDDDKIEIDLSYDDDDKKEVKEATSKDVKITAEISSLLVELSLIHI